MTDIDLHAEFPLREEIIYLNHAAVAPWPRRTAEAVKAFAEENCTQGAWDYAQWTAQVPDLRLQVARLINAPSTEDIAFVKNTSEGLSLVAYGLDWQAGDNVVISDQEFPSNRIVWESLQDRGVKVRRVSLSQGEDPEEALLARIDERTRVLAISSVQYASGLRMDLSRLGAWCRDQGVLFCVDAIQSVGALELDVQAIHADFLTADAHKWLLGPEGIGIFYCRSELLSELALHQYGWHMVAQAGDYEREEWEVAPSARRFEPGSPNMVGIHALSASLSLLEELSMAEVEARVLDNTHYLMACIEAEPALRLITDPGAGRHGGIVTFARDDVSVQALYQRLRSHGVVCAQRGGGIRFSPHLYTPRMHLDRALELVQDFKP